MPEPTIPKEVAQLLDSLRAQNRRPQRRKNLELVQKICQAQAATSRDFSISTIGRLCEIAGGISSKAIYNKSSADYRALISSWGRALTSEGEPTASMAGQQPFDGLLTKIADPAVRVLVRSAFQERQKYKNELDMLRSVTVLRIDMRPAVASPENENATTLASTITPELRKTYIEALERAISVDFFSDEGWSRGRNGEVLSEKGRKIHSVGYVDAISHCLKFLRQDSRRPSR